MTSHSPTRWLAPLALLASLVAVFVIYSNTVGGGDEPAEPASGAATTQAEREDAEGGGGGEEGRGTGTGTTAGAAARGPRSYRVRPGDTLGGIAERTGVSVDRLIELNPNVDAQSLSVGRTLRLRGGG